MNPRRIARFFEKVGAKCRKLRGKDVYECVKNDIKATIHPDKIEIRSIGEFRLDYSDFAPEGYTRGDEFLREVEDATGAVDAYLDFPGSIRTDLVLEFRPEDAGRAVRVFEKMSEHEMWVTATNISGDLRLLKDGVPVSADEWLKTLEEEEYL